MISIVHVIDFLLPEASVFHVPFLDKDGFLIFNPAVELLVSLSLSLFVLYLIENLLLKLSISLSLKASFTFEALTVTSYVILTVLFDSSLPSRTIPDNAACASAQLA